MLDALIREISMDNDLYTLSQKVADYLRLEFKSDLCSIYLKGSGNLLKRLHLSFNNIEHQNVVDELFPFIQIPLSESLTGSVIKSSCPFIFEVGENIDIYSYANELGLNTPFDKSFSNIEETISKYRKRKIKNCIFYPVDNSKENNEYYSLSAFKIDLCFTLVNVENGEINSEHLKSISNKLSSALELVKAYFFNAIYLMSSREDLEINSFIKKLQVQNLPLDNLIDLISDDFSKRLQSSHTHIWYYDEEFEVFGLQSIKIYNDSFDQPDKNASRDFLDEVDSNTLRVLKKDSSLIGEIVNNKMHFLKVDDILESSQFRWKAVAHLLPSKKFIAFPVYGSGLIGVICLHPTLNQFKFDRLSTSFFTKFLDKSILLFKYLESKKIQQINYDIFKKIREETRKNPNFIYKELLFKIQSIIGAESCSLYMVKNSNVFLSETTSKIGQIRTLKNSRICPTNNSSIIGHCAINRVSLRIFDVKNVSSFYPDIKFAEHDIIESDKNKKYISILLVPFYREMRKDGTWFMIKVVNKLNKTTNNPIGVTEFSNFDVEVVSYIGSIIENYFEIFDSIRDRNSLVELLLHEIKMPLKVIRNKSRKIDYTIKAKNIDLLSYPINDIYLNLDISKGWLDNVATLNTLFQEKNITAQPRRVQLLKVVKNSIHWQMPTLHQLGIKPSNIIDNVYISNRLHVMIDESHLYQILSNIIGNALKYRKEKERPNIIIKSTENRGRTKLIIEDHGIGVSSSDADKIFNIRYRSEYVRSHNYKGQGYGLWLSKKLADVNNCTILLENRKNPTVFSLTFK